jgi:hypothetical protein
MKRYKGKAARWQQQDKEEQRMNKTEFIKVRCTSEEKQRIKSKAEVQGGSSQTTAVRYSLTEK